MKDFSEYEVDDYLGDPSFREWVSNGGVRQQQAVWTKRLQNNPEQKEIATQARQLLIATAVKEADLPERFVENIIDNTLHEIRNPREERPVYPLRSFRPVWAAASVILLILAGLWFFRQNDTTRKDLLADKRAVLPHVAMVEKNNHTEHVIPVALPDGSTVLLQPDSRISFPEAFGDEKRDVYLSGQAFFEVTKDPQRPFYVFANEMVTRVLGTSFTVSAFDDRSSFTVIVKTGKVNVSANNKGKGQKTAPAIDLTPNQQVTFHRKELSLVRSDVKISAVPVPATENFYAFNDAPVTEIFKKLSKEYDVNIQIEEKLLADCALTTTLMDEPLFVKLKIICEAIGPGTNFSVLNDTIIINSKGCNQ